MACMQVLKKLKRAKDRDRDREIIWTFTYSLHEDKQGPWLIPKRYATWLPSPWLADLSLCDQKCAYVRTSCLISEKNSYLQTKFLYRNQSRKASDIFKIMWHYSHCFGLRLKDHKSLHGYIWELHTKISLLPNNKLYSCIVWCYVHRIWILGATRFWEIKWVPHVNPCLFVTIGAISKVSLLFLKKLN